MSADPDGAVEEDSTPTGLVLVDPGEVDESPARRQHSPPWPRGAPNRTQPACVAGPVRLVTAIIGVLIGAAVVGRTIRQ
jgi:hypothetical protein